MSSRFIRSRVSQQVGSWYGATVGTPLFPPTLGAATATDTTLSLAFTAPTAGATPTNYQYALSTDGGTTYGSYTSIGSTSSPISITGLSTNTTYSIRVRSYLTATTQFSDSAETSFNTVPSAPTSLAATATSTTSISISFSQVAGTNTITNYEYAVSSTSASAGFGSWTAFSPVDATSPVVISSLTAGTQYWAKLRAVTAFVTGIESSTANTYTLPGAPTSLAASTSTTTTQVLTFSQTGTVTNYKYAISTNAGVSYGAFTALSPVDATSPITITGLSGGTSYYVKLKSVNSSGDSPESSAVSFSTPNVPSTVDFLVIAGGGGGGGSQYTNGAGGGGGAGGLRSTVSATGGGASVESTLAVASGTPITVTIGTGGAGGGGGGRGTNGTNSAFSSITSTGGGGGYGRITAGGSGGSGGGGALSGGGGSGTAGQGYAGGGAPWDVNIAGGGGGGAGGVGASPSGGNASSGGASVSNSITGSSVSYAGGGQSGSNAGQAWGSNGAGYGGGGGGSDNSWSHVGTTGTVGYVVIRYADTFNAATTTTGSPTITVAGGYRVYEWTGSGSITF